ncbi:MAG TPA: hypothetical protein VJL28_14660 [Gemmatimonadaceae bacterium]|nr:hypothetical protein [Gemmatimonadaceae bacterium]
MRNAVRLLSAVALASGLAAGPAMAQIEAGDKSLMLHVFGQSTTGTDDKQTMVMALVGVNFFQTRNFAWRLSVTGIGGESGGDSSNGALLGAGVEWNFNSEGAKAIPFVAVDASQFMFPDANASMVSPSAGLRSFVSRSTSFDVAGSYNLLIAGGEDGGTFGFFQLRLGFSYFLGKDARR